MYSFHKDTLIVDFRKPTHRDVDPFALEYSFYKHPDEIVGGQRSTSAKLNPTSLNSSQLSKKKKKEDAFNFEFLSNFIEEAYHKGDGQVFQALKESTTEASTRRSSWMSLPEVLHQVR
jgi:hypothetical protein